METSTQCTARLRKVAISLRDWSMQKKNGRTSFARLSAEEDLIERLPRPGIINRGRVCWAIQSARRLYIAPVSVNLFHLSKAGGGSDATAMTLKSSSKVQFQFWTKVDKRGQSVHPHAFHLNHCSHSHGVHETLPCVSLPAVNETGARPVRLDWPPAESRHRTNSANNPSTAITVPAVAPLLCASPTRGRRLACGRFTHAHAHRATALIRIRLSSRSGAPPLTVSPTKTPPPSSECFPRL